MEAVKKNDLATASKLCQTLEREWDANEEALHAQAKVDFAKTQSAGIESREKLTRLLGLWGADTKWQVSPRLPDPPKNEISKTALGAEETVAWNHVLEASLVIEDHRSRGYEIAAIEIAPFVEEVRAETRALDRLQELLRNDRVGVDVRAVERRDDSGMKAERFHDASPTRSPISRLSLFYTRENKRRTSTKWPSTAAAAAIAGLTR